MTRLLVSDSDASMHAGDRHHTAIDGAHGRVEIKSFADALCRREDGSMLDDPLLARARAVWVGLAGVPVAFPAAGGAEVVVSAGSALCPPGWVGIVRLGGAAIATVPDAGLVGPVQEALAAVTDPLALPAALPVLEVLGPASLAYLDERDHRPAGPGGVEEIAGDHPDLVAFLASVPADDANEAGLAEISSAAFVVRDGPRIVAAAGYREWPGRVAHIGVLTVPAHRGRGFARAVGAAAASHGLAQGLLPQWRARIEASRRVARALGFREIGGQSSLRIGA
jgi:hypothetical protein